MLMNLNMIGILTDTRCFWIPSYIFLSMGNWSRFQRLLISSLLSLQEEAESLWLVCLWAPPWAPAFSMASRYFIRVWAFSRNWLNMNNVVHPCPWRRKRHINYKYNIEYKHTCIHFPWTSIIINTSWFFIFYFLNYKLKKFQMWNSIKTRLLYNTYGEFLTVWSHFT